jgi:hypothetical protein
MAHKICLSGNALRKWLCFAADQELALFRTRPHSAGKLPSKIGSVWYLGPKRVAQPEVYIFAIKILDKKTLRFYDSDRRTDTNYVTYSI